jgi:hypothetical protein
MLNSARWLYSQITNVDKGNIRRHPTELLSPKQQSVPAQSQTSWDLDTTREALSAKSQPTSSDTLTRSPSYQNHQC